MIKTNYLIIGSGVAGLTFAIKIANYFPEKYITIITKSNESESNTKYAQGGVAIVLDEGDSYQKHIEDTLLCGDGLCDQKVVEMVISEGPKRLKELIDWGANFDKVANGEFDLGKEGGHSENRVVHHKDQTGLEIERAILRQVNQIDNITVLDFHLALDLIMEENRCLGASVFNQKTNTIQTFLSDITLLATGGIGHVYGHTTNPIIATGDGIAMAFRANAQILDMEFIQFHPTALFEKGYESKFLISEAVRGFGAHLKTKKGNRFMQKYDTRGELASRDIVSQSIDLELKKSGDNCVYLDCTHLDEKKFKKHFPMIYDRCKSNNIAISKDWIPVIPAQHYLCGGIKVDTNGKTTIDNLFACGECSRTGLHGANRLASNSLLEALVYSDQIFNYLSKFNTTKTVFHEMKPLINNKSKPKFNADFSNKLKLKVQLLMRQNVGIIRYHSELLQSEKQLIKWLLELETTQETHQICTELVELKNMITIGILIIRHSINRNENRGGFIKFKLSNENSKSF